MRVANYYFEKTAENIADEDALLARAMLPAVLWWLGFLGCFFFHSEHYERAFPAFSSSEISIFDLLPLCRAD